MKEQFLKWIKRYGVTMWLIAAILALAASVSYAAYVNQDIKKFVLMTGKGNQAFFSSNYLYLTDIKGTNYRSRRIPSTQDANNYYTFPVKICNHVYGNEEMVNLDNINYTFAVTLHPSGGGSALPEGVESISVTVDGTQHTLPSNGELTLDGKLPGGTATTHTYTFSVPEALKNEVIFEITATPDSGSQTATNGQKLAALLAIAEPTVTRDWTGRFLDDVNHSPKEYSGFNYELSGTGEGTVTLTWDQRLQISPWFLEDNKLTQSANSTLGTYTVTMSVGGQDAPSAYQIQFYKADKTAFDGLKWNELKGLVIVKFTPNPAETTAEAAG